MGITVTVDSIDTMDASAIRRTANLFNAIADYVEGLDGKPSANPRSVVFMPRDDDHGSSELNADAVKLEELAGAGAAGMTIGDIANPFGVAVVAPVTPAPEAADASTQVQQPVPSVPVMVTPVAPPAPPAPGIDVDAKGLPWDGRIHASSRAQNADGTWRQKRGVDPTAVTQVEAELRQTMGIGAPVAVPPPPPFVAPVAPPVPPEITIPDMASAGAAPTASPSEPMSFPTLMQKITAAFASKTLSQEQIQTAIAGVGLPSLPMLGSRPDLVQQVAIALGVA